MKLSLGEGTLLGVFLDNEAPSVAQGLFGMDSDQSGVGNMVSEQGFSGSFVF